MQNIPELEGFLPEEGNIMLSASELPVHAYRYSRGIKEPYSKFTPPARFDSEGKAEKPYSGKLYITTHPISDFLTYAKPNIIREMHELGAVTTTSNIGPELEVSFLGHLPKEKFEHAQKVRVPSFYKKKYSAHYIDKYGISEEMYKLIREILRKYKTENFEWYEIKFIESYDIPIEDKDVAFFLYKGNLHCKTIGNNGYPVASGKRNGGILPKLHENIIKKLNKLEDLKLKDAYRQEIIKFATSQVDNLSYKIKITNLPKTSTAGNEIQLFLEDGNLICRLKGQRDKVIPSGKRLKGVTPDLHKKLTIQIEALHEEIEFSLADKEELIEFSTSLGLTTMHRHALQRDLADYIAMYDSVRLSYGKY